MAKGAVGLVAGYWPEDVYRYLATPGLYLEDGLVLRPTRRRGSEPAVIRHSEIITYQALSAEVDRAMSAILGLLGEGRSRVAVAVSDSVDFLKIFLGALKGRCAILLADLSASSEALRQQIQSFKPDLVVGDEPELEKVRPPASELQARLVTSQELWRVEGGPTKTKLRLGLKNAAVAIGGGGGSLVYHSHSSLLAGALSWSTFLALKEEERLLSVEPLYRWEGLYSVLPALFRGSACVMAGGERTEAVASAIRQHRPSYVLLSLERALRVAEDQRVREHPEGLQGVFVSVLERLRGDQRRRLTRLLRNPVLTVYGSPGAGPVLASHPSWFVEEAVGIPVTNVDVWPLNPATGNPLQVPWEAIEYGEVGVKSPMMPVEYHPPERAQEQLRDGWLRTGMVATMDPSGFFYFLSGV